MMNVLSAASVPADNDLQSLYGSVKALKQNVWDADEPVSFDGVRWSHSMREDAAVLLLDALKLNWSVRTLVFRNTSLDLKATKALSDVFSRSSPLQSISLSKLLFHSHTNGLPINLFEIMHLQDLLLDECTLRAESCVALGRMLRRSKEIRSLTLQSLKLSSTAWISGINCSTSLTKLHLKSMGLAQSRIEKVLKAVIENTTLTHVALDDMSLTDSNTQTLSILITRNKQLKVLSLQSNNFAGPSFKWILSLLGNTTLQSLDVSHNPLGDDGAKIIVDLLRRNSTLQTLNVVNCQFSPLGCEWIARGVATFKGLRYLSIDENAMVGSIPILETSLLYENKILRRIFNDAPTLENSPLIDPATLDAWKNVEFYLRLNRAHRRTFTAVNASFVVELLPNLLECAAAKSDVLYYCLRVILPNLANEAS